MVICTIKKVYIRFYYINVFIQTCVQLKIRNVHEMSRYIISITLLSITEGCTEKENIKIKRKANF